METPINVLPTLENDPKRVEKGERLRVVKPGVFDDGWIGKVIKTDYRHSIPSIHLEILRPEGIREVVYGPTVLSRTLSTPQEQDFQKLLVVGMEFVRAKKKLVGRIQGLVEDLRRNADRLEQNSLRRAESLGQYDEAKDNPFGDRSGDRWLSIETPSYVAQDVLHTFLWMIPNTHANDFATIAGEIERYQQQGFFLYREYVAKYGPLNEQEQIELDRYLKPVKEEASEDASAEAKADADIAEAFV